jgi:YHS domain-containing protein
MGPTNTTNNQSGGSQLDPEVQSALDPDAQKLDPNDPNVARDPVCGVLVDKRTAKDTLPAPVNMPMDTIYFHSADCKALFEQDPQKYGSNF